MKSLFIMDPRYPNRTLKTDIFDYDCATVIFEHLKKNIEQ